MAEQINRVIIVGNLTAAPELRSTPGGTPVCSFRLACTAWAPEPDGKRTDFFDVVVWGAQGENVATYMDKGKPVAVDGRLKQERWETGNGDKRSRVVIEVGRGGRVQFLPSKDRGSDGGGEFERTGESDLPAPDLPGDDTGLPTGGGLPDDDIPF